jgi:hypothetical protein
VYGKLMIATRLKQLEMIICLARSEERHRLRFSVRRVSFLPTAPSLPIVASLRNGHQYGENGLKRVAFAIYPYNTDATLRGTGLYWLALSVR